MPRPKSLTAPANSTPANPPPAMTKGRGVRAPGGGRRGVRALEHFDDAIADANCVEKTFEIEGELFDIRHAEIIGDGSEREDELGVRNLVRSFGAIGFASVNDDAA